MFNMGGSELIFIIVLAIFLIPPKKLPYVATQLGKWLHQLNQSFQEIKNHVENEVKKPIEDIANTREHLKQIRQKDPLNINEDKKTEIQ